MDANFADDRNPLLCLRPKNRHLLSLSAHAGQSELTGIRVGGKIPPPFLPSYRRRNESWRLNENENEGGRGAEKLKRGDEHAEFVRRRKKKLRTAAAAASQMSHSRKEGRTAAEIIERRDHCLHSFQGEIRFLLRADLILALRNVDSEEGAASKKSTSSSSSSCRSQTVH